MKKALALLLLAGAPLSLTFYFVYAPRQSQTVEEWADKSGQDDPAPLPPQPEPAPVAPVPPPATTPSPKTTRPAPAETLAPVEPPPEAAPPPAIERPVPSAALPVRLLVPPPADTTPMRQRAHDTEVDFQRAYAKLVAAQAKPEDKEKTTCCSTGNQ